MKTLLFAVAMCMAGMACAGICVKDGETIAFMGDSITAGNEGSEIIDTGTPSKARQN